MSSIRSRRAASQALVAPMLVALGLGGCFVERAGLGDRPDGGPPPGEDAQALIDAFVPDDAEEPPPPPPPLEPPGAPGAPTFADVGLTALTVSWTAPTSGGAAAAYQLERAADAGGMPGTFSTIAGGLGAPTHPEEGLTPDTAYWYRVRASNAAGDGPYSEPAMVTTLAPVAFTRVQEHDVEAQDPTARFPAPPTPGNLLVAIGFHREDLATASLPAGWMQIVDTHFRTGGGDRRGLTVWWKVAGTDEPQDVRLDWTPNRDSRLWIQELSAGVPGVTWSHESSAAVDRGTMEVTELTVAVGEAPPPGDLLIVGALGSRDGPGEVSWSAPLGDPIGVIDDDRSVATAYGPHAGGAAPTIGATWENTRHATMAISVFRASR